MFILSYVGSGGLFAVAGVQAVKSTLQGNAAAVLEEGLKNGLPEEEGKASYVALKCMGQLHPFSILSSRHNILLGRVKIEKITSHSDVGVGFSLEGKGDIVLTTTPRVDRTAIQFSIPEKSSFQCAAGNVIAHHLDLATWKGSEKSTKTYRPKEAAVPLREMDFQPDMFADRYRISVESFSQNYVYIFAKATKSGETYHLNPPANNYPFLVTTEDPQLFVPQERLKANRSKWKATASAFTAVALASGGRSMQLLERAWEEEWLIHRCYPNTWRGAFTYKPLQMVSCAALCAISSVATIKTLMSRPANV